MKQLLSLLLFGMCCGVSMADDKTQYVDPFIGTQSAAEDALSGSTFPGACVPYGLVQLSPDTEYHVKGNPCSGYNYDKDRFVAISHTHLSGTGCSDLLDVSIMPFTDEVSADYLYNHKFDQSYSHDEEGAEPGYYWVKLKESGVKVELTATERCGIHRYTFPEGAPQHVAVDLGNTVFNYTEVDEGVLRCQLRIVDDHTLEGYRLVTGWARLRRVYFKIEFSKPFVSHLLMDNKRDVGSGMVSNCELPRAALTFEGGGELMVKVALSTVDGEGARRNFDAEVPDWDFDGYRQKAHDKWEQQLAMIDVNGSDEEKRIFYTGMYHLMIQPNVMNDVDGRYVTTTYETRQLKAGQNYYSTFSLWDTFRAAHPLYNLLDPVKTAEFINSMIIHQQDYGFLPIWDLWAQDNYCMIGNHALPVISRAILTGMGGFNYEAAYRAMFESATLTHYNSQFAIWEKYGYMPEPLQTQSVSITLEEAFDDWCVYAVAKHLGKDEDVDRFWKRSEFYRNLFDSSIGFFAPKDENGQWIRPFNPLTYGANGGNPFTEGNAWQYLWFVPHNPDALIDLLGGEKKFVDKLNENFTLTDREGETNDNASGLIGQYAHGNEPSHHTAYFYNFAKASWRTQEMVNEIRSRFYSDKPDGYCGNEDCGQMSAWYLFSAMGFYPFNAGSDDFVVGTPLFTETTIHLPNDKTLTIKAPRKSKDEIYVRSVRLNGRELKDLRFTQQDVINGGVMEFVMAKSPKK